MSHLGISYGMMSEPIADQIKKQGYLFDEKKVEQFQKELSAMHLLRFDYLTSETLYDKLLKKLHTKVVNHVTSKNKATLTPPTDKNA